MQNLNPSEIEEWKARCRKQREIARANPCTEPVMCTCLDFEATLGPWNPRLVIKAWVKPPIWDGSISYFKHIGDETIYDKNTGLPIFEAPQDALLCVKDWSPEELDIARGLLGDLFGPLIHHRDQQVVENKGLFCLTWMVTVKSAQQSVAASN